MPRADVMTRVDAFWSGVIFVLAALALALLASPWLHGGDSAEFVYLASGQGIAHQPGYPLYSWLLRTLAPLLPAVSAAQAAARVTACCAAAALAAVFIAVRAHGGTRVTAAIAVALLATQPLFVKFAIHAEVFALHAFFVAALVAWCGDEWRLEPGARAVALAAMAGLALSHHQTAVLLAPLGVVAWWRAMRGGAGSGSGRLLVVCVVAFGVGLTWYLTLFERPDADPLSSFAAPQSAAELWHYFLRSGYGSLSSSASHGGGAGPLVELGRLLHTLLSGGGLILVPLVWFARSQRLLIACLLLSGPLFVMAFAAPDTDAGRAVVERFHLMPLVLLVILAGIGAARLRRPWPLAWLAWLPFQLGFTLHMLEGFRLPQTEQQVREMLQVAQPHAIIVSAEDTFLFVARELKREGVRGDVATLSATATRSQRLRQVYRRELQLQSELTDPKRYIFSLLATGRPVYATSRFSEQMLAALPHEREGELIRLHLPQANILTDP